VEWTGQKVRVNESKVLKVLKVLNFWETRKMRIFAVNQAVSSALHSPSHSESQRGISSRHVLGAETISVCSTRFVLVERFQTSVMPGSRPWGRPRRRPFGASG
jgi:hypothetical protein